MWRQPPRLSRSERSSTGFFPKAAVLRRRSGRQMFNSASPHPAPQPGPVPPPTAAAPLPSHQCDP